MAPGSTHGAGCQSFSKGSEGSGSHHSPPHRSSCSSSVMGIKSEAAIDIALTATRVVRSHNSPPHRSVATLLVWRQRYKRQIGLLRRLPPAHVPPGTDAPSRRPDGADVDRGCSEQEGPVTAPLWHCDHSLTGHGRLTRRPIRTTAYSTHAAKITKGRMPQK